MEETGVAVENGKNHANQVGLKERIDGHLCSTLAFGAFKTLKKFVFDKNGESSFLAVVRLDTFTTSTIDTFLESFK